MKSSCMHTCTGLLELKIQLSKLDKFKYQFAKLIVFCVFRDYILDAEQWYAISHVSIFKGVG